MLKKDQRKPSPSQKAISPGLIAPVPVFFLIIFFFRFYTPVANSITFV
jgi:hypothetical protein